MSRDNKYNSLIETFTSDPIINEALSNFGVPPADITLVPGDFSPAFLYAAGGDVAAGQRIKFAINDQVRILGFGLFSNLADGLVTINSPDTFENGPGFGLTLAQYDGANVNQGTVGTPQIFRCPELNHIFETDFLFDVSGIDTSLDSLRLSVTMPMLGMVFATISIDPAWATKNITFRPVVVIEHTFPLTAE